MWPFNRKGASGFSYTSTAEEVTEGIDGRGLTAIVTGASSGIGAETARVLAMRGVHVVMGVRNLSAGNDVKEAISKEVPTAKVDVLNLDLSSMASVRRFASDFDSLELPLNILVNNAGIMGVPFSLSHDGMELHFATNHQGHFLLTHLLLKNMKDTSCRSNFEGRIVNVTSEGHKLVHHEGIRFNRINDESGYFSYFAYGQSKLANILHANELSRLLKKKNENYKGTWLYILYCLSEEEVKITANSVHPGVIFTNLFRYHSIMNAVTNTLCKMVMKNVQQGAATTCYVALHPQLEGVTGKYFSNSNLSTPSKKASDADLAKKLWDFSLNAISPQHQAPIDA